MIGKNFDREVSVSKLRASLEELTTDNFLAELKEEIIKEFIDRLKSEDTALVFSVVPLTDEEKTRLSEIFSRLLNRPIRVKNIIDKNLLGGLKVAIGDWKFDATLSRLLNTLKEEICQI